MKANARRVLERWVAGIRYVDAARSVFRPLSLANAPPQRLGRPRAKRRQRTLSLRDMNELQRAAGHLAHPLACSGFPIFADMREFAAIILDRC
jgi:hypothetical protein